MAGPINRDQSSPSLEAQVVKKAQLDDLVDLCHNLMLGRQMRSRKELEELLDRALTAFPEWSEFREQALSRLERSL
jgi:hypothetical protein